VGADDEPKLRVRMKAYFVALLLVLAGLAYVVGYWPERQRRLALEARVSSQGLELAEAQARVRMGALLGQLLVAEDAVAAQNYGQAQALCSQFFDAARAETTRTAAGGLKDALDKVARMRDLVTASLTRGDPESLALLREAQAPLRSALGFPPPATP
jgi:hypothetical protein